MPKVFGPPLGRWGIWGEQDTERPPRVYGLTRSSRICDVVCMSLFADDLSSCRYNACDVGTLRNQTYANGTTPAAAKTSGSNDYGGELSWVRRAQLSVKSIVPISTFGLIGTGTTTLRLHLFRRGSSR